MATIQLQFVGRVPAQPAGNIRVGDKLMWNHGATSTVVAIVKETAKTIWVEERGERGTTHVRRMAKTRLVCNLTNA